MVIKARRTMIFFVTNKVQIINLNLLNLRLLNKSSYEKLI